MLTGADGTVVHDGEWWDGKRHGASLSRTEEMPGAKAALATAAAIVLAGLVLWRCYPRRRPAPASTFGASNFKRAYDFARCPEFQDELLLAVRQVVQDFGRCHHVSEFDTRAFYTALQREWTGLDELIAVSAQKVWTSAQQLQGREFCSIYGEALRKDAVALSEPCAKLARALNANLVGRGTAFADQRFPRGPGSADARDRSTDAGIVWRGGGFMDNDATRAFFGVPGRKYRVVQLLATSFDRAVARHFIGRVQHNAVVNARVLWRVELDPVRGCKHVNLVTETHVPGEFEFLFAAFSAFEVVHANWSPTPQDPARPHEIMIRAAVDNSVESEDLPLAPWC
jgi:hypothetical protein